MRGVGLGQALGQHLHGDVIGDVAALLQDGFDPLAEVGSLGDMVAEHLARRDVRDTEPPCHERSLGPLPGPGRADEQQLHGRCAPVVRGAWCVVRPERDRRTYNA